MFWGNPLGYIADLQALRRKLKNAEEERDEAKREEKMVTDWWLNAVANRDKFKKKLTALKAKHIALAASMRTMGYIVQEQEEMDDEKHI